MDALGVGPGDQLEIVEGPRRVRPEAQTHLNNRVSVTLCDRIRRGQGTFDLQDFREQLYAPSLRIDTLVIVRLLTIWFEGGLHDCKDKHRRPGHPTKAGAETCCGSVPETILRLRKGLTASFFVPGRMMNRGLDEFDGDKYDSRGCPDAGTSDSQDWKDDVVE